jgi:hypothetical protein
VPLPRAASARRSAGRRLATASSMSRPRWTTTTKTWTRRMRSWPRRVSAGPGSCASTAQP